MAKIALGKLDQPNFIKAMEILLQERLPIPVSFRIKTLASQFNNELKKFQELRKSIADRHCIKGEDGSPALEGDLYRFAPENVEEFTKEMNELASIEIEFTPIGISELGSKVELTGDQLFALEEVLSV